MDFNILQNLLDKISGCSFASIDAVCFPKTGVRLEIQGERVIMFTNKTCSGYENMVRRGLMEAGKDPDSFVLGKLPWGERVPESPLITHKGKYYLQTIVLAHGSERWFKDDIEVDVSDLKIAQRYRPDDPDKVEVHTYKLESITRIALMGQILVADETKAIMPLSV